LVHIEKSLLVPGESADSFFEEWAACLFVARHRQFLLFTEALTLFSIVAPADKLTDSMSLTKLFVNSVSKAMLDLVEGGGPDEVRIEGIEFTKTKNDGLRRAQIDMAYHASAKIEEGKNSFEINRIPIKSIGYRFPVDRFITEVGLKLKATGELWSFVPEML